MLDKVESLILKARKASDIIMPFNGEIRVVSHYDCDGICSGSIIAKALLREGKRFRLSFVKQLTEEVVGMLSKKDSRLTIFVDMGSGQLDAIQSKLMKPGGSVIVLDHHQPQGEVLSDRLHHINTYAMGMGDNISGSGIAYILVRTMNPENKDLSELGVVGAIGDSQIDSIGPDWGLFGLNREILKDAISTGKIKVERGLRIWGRTTRPVHKALEFSMDPYIPGVSGSESGAVHFLQELGIELKNGSSWRTLSDLSEEEMRKLASGIVRERVMGNHDNPEWIFGDVYTLNEKKECNDANEFATLLNAAGKQGLGYLGLGLCLNSVDSFDEVQGVLDSYRREISRALEIACSGGKGKVKTKAAKHAVYITAGDAIPESVISNVTSILSRSGRFPEMPLFSFVDSEGNKTKISARLPGSMTGGINLKEVVEEAAKSVGGEGGGHSNAAGASIPKGSEEMFINSIETILSNLKGQGIDADGRGNKGERAGEEAAPRAERGREGPKKMEGQGLVRYISA